MLLPWPLLLIVISGLLLTPLLLRILYGLKQAKLAGTDVGKGSILRRYRRLYPQSPIVPIYVALELVFYGSLLWFILDRLRS